MLFYNTHVPLKIVMKYILVNFSREPRDLVLSEARYQIEWSSEKFNNILCTCLTQETKLFVVSV
jgi:hypothetical protein